MTPGRRWGTPTDAFGVIVGHRLLSSPLHGRDDSAWLACPFLDVVLPPSMIFGSIGCRFFVGRHGRTMIDLFRDVWMSTWSQDCCWCDDGQGSRLVLVTCDIWQVTTSSANKILFYLYKQVHCSINIARRGTSNIDLSTDMHLSCEDFTPGRVPVTSGSLAETCIEPN